MYEGIVFGPERHIRVEAETSEEVLRTLDARLTEEKTDMVPLSERTLEELDGDYTLIPSGANSSTYAVTLDSPLQLQVSYVLYWNHHVSVPVGIVRRMK